MAPVDASAADPGTAGFQPAARQGALVHADRGWFSRGYLPHFDHAAVIQVVTYHLADSLPTEVAQRLAEGSEEQETRRRYESYLDAGHGSCVLRDPTCADVVERAFLFFDGQRYRLLAWVVMPNHVHVMIEQLPGHSLAALVHSWKRHTATEINRLRGTNGALWRREYWDRFVRDDRHFQAARHYIEHNPVAAGLVGAAAEWPWSSANRAHGPVGNRRSQGCLPDTGREAAHHRGQA